MSSNINELQEERDYLVSRVQDARDDIHMAERQWGTGHYLTEVEIKRYKDLVELIRQNETKMANAISKAHPGGVFPATEIFGNSDIEKPI